MGTSRQPTDAETLRFSLMDELEPDALQNIDALVHCAYDFGPNSWEEIYHRNVLGTRQLLQAAKSAGVKTIVTISSISAFPECKSLYGRAKLEIENETLAVGGSSLRPGLIYGGSNRGMYGRLTKQVTAAKPIPLLAGSPCIQYLVHVEDLCRVIEAILSAKVPAPRETWTIAHSRPRPLRKLLQAIATTEKVSIHFVPIPWQFVWFGLKCAEIVGLKLGFKSDSVRSLVHQNLKLRFGDAEQSGPPLRDFGASAPG